MIIECLQQTREDNRAVISAKLRWEACHHPVDTLYFETVRSFEDDLAASPEAFLVGAFLPAIHFGEKRIVVDGPVCPGLMEGLKTAMALFHGWYGQRYRPISITCTQTWQSPPQPTKKPRPAIFLSGGVDSLAVLRSNHLSLPSGHPDRFKDGVFIYGHDIGGILQRGAEADAYARARCALQKVADGCEITLIPVRTNVRHLCDDHQFWMRFFYAAALAAVGHALSPRIGQVSIASGNVIAHLRPWGSHPVLDPCYSSGSLCVRHAGLHQTRLQRVKLLTQWPMALAGLRVCGHNPESGLNCGVCEKCVRTMIHLAALGKLQDTDVFPVRDIGAALLQRQLLMHAFQLAPYVDALPLLIEARRYDLARAINVKLLKYKFFYRHLEDIDVKKWLKRLDRLVFKERLLAYYRYSRQKLEKQIQ